jgi:hypothetical protein
MNSLKASNTSTTGKQCPLILIEENSDGNSHDSDPELNVATQDPVAAMLPNMERFHFE